MKKPEPKRKKSRASRIRVPDQERALFNVAGTPFVGVLRKLSTSGGSAILAHGPIHSGTAGGVVLKTTFGKVTANVEFLQTFADGVPLAQAFRFVSMDELSSKRLASAAENMEREGYSDNAKAEASDEQKSDPLGILLRSVRQLAAGLVPAKTANYKIK